MDCFFCQKKEHMIAKCRKRLAANHGTNQNPTQAKRGSTQLSISTQSDTDVSDSESVAVDDVFISSLGSDKYCWRTAIRIGNKLVNCKIDIGAGANIMPRRVYN